MSQLTIREWLVQNKDRYEQTYHGRKGWIKDCADSLGFPITSIRRKACEIWPSRSNNKKFAQNDEDVINPKKFIAEIDIVKQVEDFLDTIVKDGYIECEKLRKRLEISATKWRELKVLKRFSNRRFTYSKHTGMKVTVWSSEKGIQLAKDTISMSRYEV